MKNASTKHTSKVSWILSGGKVNYSGSETSLTVVSAHDFPPLNDKINTLWICENQTPMIIQKPQ